jgi:hypothetical protein
MKTHYKTHIKSFKFDYNIDIGITNINGFSICGEKKADTTMTSENKAETPPQTPYDQNNKTIKINGHLPGNNNTCFKENNDILKNINNNSSNGTNNNQILNQQAQLYQYLLSVYNSQNINNNQPNLFGNYLNVQQNNYNLINNNNSNNITNNLLMTLKNSIGMKSFL